MDFGILFSQNLGENVEGKGQLRYMNCLGLTCMHIAQESVFDIGLNTTLHGWMLWSLACGVRLDTVVRWQAQTAGT